VGGAREAWNGSIVERSSDPSYQGRGSVDPVHAGTTSGDYEVGGVRWWPFPPELSSFQFESGNLIMWDQVVSKVVAVCFEGWSHLVLSPKGIRNNIPLVPERQLDRGRVRSALDVWCVLLLLLIHSTGHCIRGSSTKRQKTICVRN
jgi:hypothetical protein